MITIIAARARIHVNHGSITKMENYKLVSIFHKILIEPGKTKNIIIFRTLISRFFPYTSSMQKIISWSEFESVELRVGTIITVEDFPEARKAAYKLTVDFGDEIGIKKSSAQITIHYTKDELIGKQII